MCLVCAKYMHKFPYFSQRSYEVGTLTISSLHMKKLRPREVVGNESHTASKGRSHNSNPCGPTSDSIVLTLLSISYPFSLASLPQMVLHINQMQFLQECMPLCPQGRHQKPPCMCKVSCMDFMPSPSLTCTRAKLYWPFLASTWPALLPSRALAPRLPSPPLPLKWSLLWLLEKCHHCSFGEGSLLWMSEKCDLFIVQRVSGPKLSFNTKLSSCFPFILAENNVSDLSP